MKKPTKRQVASALKKARKLIEKPENWCQGMTMCTTSNGVREYCAWGAVFKSSKQTNINCDLMRYAEEALNAATPQKFADVIAYNDKPGRRHRDVLRLFDKAIASLEAA